MEETTKDLSVLGPEEYVTLELSGSGPVSLVRTIYKVPERIRKIREEAYTPRLVSIGPLHRGAISLQSAEGDKIKYANSYFSKFPTSEKWNFVEAAKRWERSVRACYDDIIKLSSNEFIYMTLVDGIFIVEFLLKNVNRDLREPDDEIFQKDWICKEILHDIILLENQLPFFVMEYIFNRLNDFRPLHMNLLDLVYQVFRDPLQFREPPNYILQGLEEISHLVFIFFLLFASNLKVMNPMGGKLVDTSSAVELQAAGVRFVGVERKCLDDIEFDTNTGELRIPRLVVNQWTDSFLRNISAFEKCQFSGTILSSYIILMDNLINTVEDVKLLVDSGIIETQSSNEDVCTLFNNLYKRTALDDNKFLFTDLCKDLNAYSRDYWHQWKAASNKWQHMLKHDYFSNPWTIISVVAAAILLILTVIQTACAIKGLKHPGV